ncbi:hypothetical protein R6Q59_003935 [Mikania micrantha]|uniref:Homeobox domain-containing protein n=1 Tax=Mikania micrantha TaxID=192012 RepID=A0A5N6MML6_9ASTR|nr:hypothetical protein E3N88_30582 [Mikania micrantha]
MIAGAGGEDFCQFDESSLHRCEPNERSSQRLSLSLSSTNPSAIRIQPFEVVRQPQNHHHNHHHHHQGYYGKPLNIYEQLTNDQDDLIRQSVNIMNTASEYHSAQYNLRSSRYLVHAQDLLIEFCNLDAKQQNDHLTKTKAQRTNHCQDHDNVNNISSKNIALNCLEFVELQKRKSKLLQMLDEVDRKYHNYSDQMKALVSSFEAVAGKGAARVYLTLASKAMSRHFKCLRDGVVGQIKETKKAMGEKDISARGATRGETPRLRLVDQTLRQQRALQQSTMMDGHSWRPQRGLPEQSVTVLRAWLFENFLHPYPNDVDKHILAQQSGLSRSQVSNWFINARVRLWKPMVEEMYLEETKDNDHDQSIDQQVALDRFNATINHNTNMIIQMEQKPNMDQLIRRDSDCLSSIINRYDHQHNTKTVDHDIHQSFPRDVPADCFGAAELDFSAYNHNFGGNVGGVSLTLGLHQHAGGGSRGGNGGGGDGSLYYPRDHIEDCQTPIPSLLEDDQGHNLPYNRNLTGVQLFHDLAG